MNNHRAAIKDFLATQAGARASFLTELVKVPSDNPPGDLQAHADCAAGLLGGLGFEVERHPVPANITAEAGLQSVTNLVVRRRYGDGPTIALNAHGDVVPPGAGWQRDPYGAEIVDGTMFGRGVAVSKSDFATYAFAVLALEAACRPTNGAIELHFTYDEETGGDLGPGWLLSRNISQPDMAICAGFSYSVVTAHNGCLHLQVRLHGRQGHAALPSTGIDALEAATEVLSALYSHRSDLSTVRSEIDGIGSPSLVIGTIAGGVNTNVVPDLVCLRLDRRLIPEEDAPAVEAALRALIQDAAASRPDVGVEIERLLLAKPLVPTTESSALAELIGTIASDVMGEPVGPKGVPLYTDARHYAEAGIPTVLYGAGPHDINEANAHAADECLKLSDLAKATEVVALTLADLLAQG